MGKFLHEGHKFAGSGRATDHFVRSLVQMHNWTWAAAATPTRVCHLIHGDTYLSCLGTGRFWLDAPDPLKAGCYGLHSLTGKFGWDVGLWDMKRFRKDPVCIRPSKEKHDDFLPKASKKEQE
jgi:hypothetical protein